MVLPPEISESAESQTLDIEKILHAPNCGELYRNLAVRSAAVTPLVIHDIFAENLEVQCILEILAVEEPVNTAEECMIDFVRTVHTAIVLHMEAERGELAVLPEIQATGDLEVSSDGALFPSAFLAL